AKNAFDEIVMENNLVSGWVIPSKFGYPVDSDEKLIHTAASLSGLVVLGIASEDPTDEETYGVVEPEPGLKAGQEGVGTKVTLKDREKQDVASIIIGKAVKDEADRRFVRIPGQRFIYVCEYDPSILKTDFFAWINPKILDFGNRWSISKLSIDKYSLAKSALLEIEKSYLADLVLERNQWTTRSFSDGGDPTAKPLLDVAELERVRLALENFEIQDVNAKSLALAISLRERKGIPNTFKVVNAIQKYGFFVDEQVTPARSVGAGGELAFTETSGIRYRMLFGGMTAAEVTGRSNDQRYVMVSADVDESMFPLPAEPGKQNNSKASNEPPKPPKAGCGFELTQEDDDRESRRQYQIKLEERKKKLEAAREVADKINDRFSNWFYIIDNALYSRLMPSKSVIVSRNQ
ncbi:MAG: DUF4340 domain-containing protein, partial [Planctomycetota bacterium]|nr:DUF4340 domain-containing protein [Planctomycetota bacterium]